jgi:hypothetical protein
MTNEYSVSYCNDTVKCICGKTFSIDNPELIYCPCCGQFYNKLDKFKVVIGD